MTRSKYGVRTDAKGKADRTIDGIQFASKREAKRYSELKMLQGSGVIRELKLQPEFLLEVNGHKIGKYRGDFQYENCEFDALIIEDSKGFKTPEYKLKRKLMKAIHGIEIQEV